MTDTNQAAAAVEREQIVVWLRRQEARHRNLSSVKQTRMAEIATLAMLGAYAYAAEAIQAGDHIASLKATPDAG